MLNVAAPVTLKNILVATDFSPLWNLALPFVSAVAKWQQANITFLNVIPIMIFPEMPLEPYPPAEEKEREETLARLHTVAEKIPVPDSQKSTVVRVGDTIQAILDLVAERHIDLVFVTTHARGVMSSLVLGSTAEHILRTVSCPVLSIGPKTDPTLDLEHISCIVVPVDFSDVSKSAVNFAVGLAMEHHSKIVLLHVIDHTAPPYKIESSEIFANREIQNIDTAGVSTERIVRIGKVNEEIIEAAKGFAATCMVMGRHKHGALSTHLPLTTLHYIAPNAPCPVFTVA